MPACDQVASDEALVEVGFAGAEEEGLLQEPRPAPERRRRFCRASSTPAMALLGVALLLAVATVARLSLHPARRTAADLSVRIQASDSKAKADDDLGDLDDTLADLDSEVSATDKDKAKGKAKDVGKDKKAASSTADPLADVDDSLDDVDLDIDDDKATKDAGKADKADKKDHAVPMQADGAAGGAKAAGGAEAKAEGKDKKAADTGSDSNAGLDDLDDNLDDLDLDDGSSKKGGKAKGGDKVKKTTSGVVKKYGQCGGESWTGATCCQKGCACIIKTTYFSLCQTPTGSADCDLSAAKDEVKEAIIRAKLAGPQITELREQAEAAEKLVEPARKAEEEVKAIWEPLRDKGATKKEAMDSANAKVKDLRAKADKASKDAAVLGKALWEAGQNYSGLAQQLEMNKGGKCQGIGGRCGGQGLPAGTACCIMGCNCVYKNAFYADCRPPPGTSGCDAGAQSRAEAAKQVLDDLQAKTDAATKVMNETEKAAKDAEAFAANITQTADEAGAKRRKAEKAFKAKESDRIKKEKAASDLARKAKHAVNAVKFEAANANTWKKAAQGESCSDLVASEVAVQAVQDYGGSTVTDDEVKQHAAESKGEVASEDADAAAGGAADADPDADPGAEAAVAATAAAGNKTIGASDDAAEDAGSPPNKHAHHIHHK